jgi:hypothetical protein
MKLEEAIEHLEENLADPGHDWGCEECKGEHEQLLEWLRELKEAKRLLKSAIDEWNFVCEWGDCGEYCGWFENGKCTQEWSGKAEALALIGEENNDEKNT